MTPLLIRIAVLFGPWVLSVAMPGLTARCYWIP